MLVSSDGKCQLADFGLATFLHDREIIQNLTLTSDASMTHGSIRWMAPELVQSYSESDGIDFNAQSDLWALGCLILVRVIPSNYMALTIKI